MTKRSVQLQAAHTGLATVTIAAMAMVLAVGLKAIGLTERMDGLLTAAFLPSSMKQPTLSLHPAIIWAMTLFLVIILPFVILRVAGSWQRYIVWSLTTSLSILWAPILILSSHKPEISTAIIAIFWSGCCSMFYAHNHRLPADEPLAPPKSPTDATR